MSHKPIMLVGDYWSEEDERRGQPFSGPAGGMLKSLLAQAGIPWSDCYATNVFNLRPAGNDIESLYATSADDRLPLYRPITGGKYISRRYAPEISRLFEELDRVSPNVVVALGNTPLWALCKKSGIKKYRGSPLPDHTGTYKVIPTWHPSFLFRQYELRVVSLADFYKVKREAAFLDVRRPKREIWLEPTIDEIWEFYHSYLKSSPFISCDIETKQRTITEVGYADADGKHAIVIPFYRRRGDGNYWPSAEEERTAWEVVRWINNTKPLVGQNFAYDMKYFLEMGITCKTFEGDSMLLHHALQPEMEKGLGFLGSVYTNEPSWKFMRADAETLKQGDD